jgi:hypothetical protein
MTRSAASGKITPFNARIYGGKFNDAMNDIYSPNKIKGTADLIINTLEKQLNMTFTPGKFNRYLLLDKTILPQGFGPSDFDKFEADFATIPQAKRKMVADKLRANFISDTPLPIYCKVEDNIDDTHDVIIKNFTSKSGVAYIGVLYLCPNPSPPL